MSKMDKVKFLANITAPNLFSYELLEALQYLFPDNELLVVPFGTKTVEQDQYQNEYKVIVLPNTVTQVGPAAFDRQTQLKSISIPASVTKIDDDNGAFLYCTNLENIVVDSNNEKYTTINGDLYSKDGKHLIRCAVGKLDEEDPESVFLHPDSLETISYNALYGYPSRSITLPFVGRSANNEQGSGHFGYIFGARSYVDQDQFLPGLLSEVTITGGTSIPEHAFTNCGDILSIQLTEGIKSIGNKAFSECHGLNKIKIPNSLEEIGENVFDNTNTIMEADVPVIAFNKLPQNNLKYVTIRGNDKGSIIEYRQMTEPNNSLNALYIRDGVQEIGKNAFEDYLALHNLSADVSTIGNEAFKNCVNLVSVTLGNVSTIGNSAFEGCYKISTNPDNNVLRLPSSITDIGADAFKMCDIHSVYYTGTIENWLNINFGNGNANPLSGTLFGDSKFYYDPVNGNYSILSELVVPDTITEIKDYAFYGARNIESVVIPDSVEKIGEHAFYGCDNIETAKLPAIGLERLPLDNLKTVTITSGTIEDMEYMNSNYGIRNITFNKAVEEIGENAFYGTNIANVTIGESIPKEEEENGYGTIIKTGAFGDCINLRHVTINNSVSARYIKSGVLASCTNISKLTVPFSENTNMAIGDLFETPNNLMASEGYKLNDVIVADGTTMIPPGAFKDCAQISKVILPDSLTTIGARAFYNCASLKEIIFKGTAEQWHNIKKMDNWDSGIYDNCGIFCTDAIVPNSQAPEYSEDELYYECFNTNSDGAIWKFNGYSSYTSTDSVYIPSRVLGVTAIADRVFAEFTNIQRVIIEPGFTFIGDEAFKNCESLAQVFIDGSELNENNVLSLGKDVFNGCNSLREIHFNNTIAAWNDYVSKDTDWANSAGYDYAGGMYFKILCTDGYIEASPESRDFYETFY